MSSLQIVPHPHPALRWKSKELRRIDTDLKTMVAQMFELMYEAKGIGLAANQVALPYRLFVINPSGDPALKDEEFVFINPEIVRRNGSEESEEGCLSLPEIHGLVPRATRIVVDAFDLDGQQFEMELGGLDARVVQHENDHLDGILFPDRISPESQKQIAPLMDALEREFRQRQQAGQVLSDEKLKQQLIELEAART
ncbi:MAG: peptide deformylase [Planctomycetaceae bacterium]|nr:peptide deformylase [Planctomycetaceae bacterium]